jgi:hypothetical protein
MVDAGLPDGINGAVVYRLTPRIRLHGGGSYNLISPGVRAGVSLLALRYWVTPSVTLEAGRYFAGDANPLVGGLSGKRDLDDPALREIAYDYANGHVGLELGSSRITVYVHAGFSVLWTALRNLNESAAAVDHGTGEDTATVEFRGDPTLRVFGPSARVGVIIYF